MKYVDLTCREYTKQLSSKAPVPGGGGTSALAAALGAALGTMVGNLTTGKKKYADVEEEIQRLIKESENLSDELLRLADEDAEAFEPLSRAYSIPAGEEKDRVMEECLKNAADVPLRIMRACRRVIDVLDEFAHKGSRLAVSDAGCGAALVRGAMQSAALNVYINTKSMKDRAYAEKLDAEVSSMLNEYIKKADSLYDYVIGELR